MNTTQEDGLYSHLSKDISFVGDDSQQELFEIQDSSWGSRKEKDLVFALKNSFLRPYPLSQPSKDKDGNHQTNVVVKTKFAEVNFVCTKEYGVPVAKDNILEILVWGIAIKNDNRIVDFGPVSNILNDLGMRPHGKSYDWLRKAFLRLATSSAYLRPLGANGEKSRVEILKPEDWIEYMNLWFGESYDDEIGNRIVIKESFFNNMKKLNLRIDLDLAILRKIKDVPGATQLYLQSLFLNMEVNRGPSSIGSIELEDLQAQMGASESMTKPKFKQQVNKWFNTIQKAYRDTYGDGVRGVPFYIAGDTLLFHKGNLIPTEVEIEESQVIADYFKSLKTASSRKDERSYLTLILGMGYSMQDFEDAIVEMSTYGDETYRPKKRMGKYLSRKQNMELILNRSRNRMETIQ